LKIDNFVVLDSIYGKFIVARTCTFQAEALVKTGLTHIENELANIFAIIDTLPNDCIVVDGGANIGFFTVPVAQRIKQRGGKVISFEPQRQLFNALSGSLALNDLDNVFLHNMGLGDGRQSTACLPAVDYSVVQDFGTVSLSVDDKVEEHHWMRTRSVDIDSIDSLMLPRLNFIKLDVEGFEIPALVGALKAIANYRPYIWVEYFITGAKEIKQALSTITDYSYYIVDYQNMLCIPNEQLDTINMTNCPSFDD
jgi:FkbM family methyltransferase